MFKPSRILVPTDLSDHSLKAIRQAIDIAKQYGAEIFLLHVIQNPIRQCTVDYCMSEDLMHQYQSRMDEAMRDGMRGQLAIFPGTKGVEITTDVRKGVPHDEILREAEERGIDLIVIASLGSSGLAKYLMGSVARHVLLGASCPVLLTR